MHSKYLLVSVNECSSNNENVISVCTLIPLPRWRASALPLPYHSLWPWPHLGRIALVPSWNYQRKERRRMPKDPQVMLDILDTYGGRGWVPMFGNMLRRLEGHPCGNKPSGTCDITGWRKHKRRAGRGEEVAVGVVEQRKSTRNKVVWENKSLYCHNGPPFCPASRWFWGGQPPGVTTL